MTLGMQREKSATARAMRMSDVVFGFIWQVLFTPDPISYLSVLGAILVTGSIMVVVIFKPSNPPAVASPTNGSSSTTAAIELTDIDSSAHAMLHKFQIDDDEDNEEDLDTIQLYHHSMKAKALGSVVGYRQVSASDSVVGSPIHNHSKLSTSADSMEGVEIARVSSVDIEHGCESPSQLHSNSQDELRRALQGNGTNSNGDYHTLSVSDGISTEDH